MQVTLGGLEHGLTPIAAASPCVHVIEEPTLFLDALWLPYRREHRPLERAIQEAGPVKAVFGHADVVDPPPPSCKALGYLAVLTVPTSHPRAPPLPPQRAALRKGPTLKRLWLKCPRAIKEACPVRAVLAIRTWQCWPPPFPLKASSNIWQWLHACACTMSCCEGSWFA